MSIPDPLETARAALEPGETLVWAGQPHVAFLARGQFDLKAFFLSAPASIVAVILVWQAVASGFSRILHYLFLPAAAICLFVAALPLVAPLRAARRARSTVYAVTDRRLFILELYPDHRLRSFAPHELEAPRVRERAGGRADVIFGSVVEREETRQGQRSRLRAATFFGIHDAPQVAAHIAALRTQAPSGQTAAEGRR